MDYEKKIDIPFGALDSELLYQEINIPDGFEATIEGNKVILKRKESEDERIRKAISDILLIDSDEIREILDANNVLMQDIDTWLEKQDGQKPVPDWMPKFLDELRTKKNYFDWDEHKDIEGYILVIINWMKPNYFNRKDDEHKPAWSKEERERFEKSQQKFYDKL